MAKKSISESELFLRDINGVIKNLLITNINYSNNYYSSEDIWEFMKDTIERAKYVLNRIDQLKHLLGMV